MASNYPSSLQTFTNPSGTSALATGPDHAALHTTENDTLVALQNTLGTNAGTSIAKNFNSGDFAVRSNASNVLQQPLSGTIGTLSGQMSNTGTVANGVYGTATYQGGTGSSMTLGTPSISNITTSGTTVPTQMQRAIIPIVGTLADASGGTITPNAASQQIVEVTLGTNATNRTLGTPTNATDGQFLGFRIKQNAAAVGTILFAPLYRFNSGGTPLLGAASSWNYIGFRYSATDSKWDHQGVSLSLV
jgi:hypothetical protein